MLKTLRCSSLVLAAALILVSALAAAPVAPPAPVAPVAQAPSPALAQILGAAAPAVPAAPTFLAHAPALFGQPTSFQCAELPVDCCQVGFNGHCRYCIHQDPTCSLP